METIGLVLGLVVAMISIGLLGTVKKLIKLIQYIIKAKEDGFSEKEQAKITELAKDFTGSLIKTIMKSITTKIDKNTKAKDVISKLK